MGELKMTAPIGPSREINDGNSEQCLFREKKSLSVYTKIEKAERLNIGQSIFVYWNGNRQDKRRVLIGEFSHNWGTVSSYIKNGFSLDDKTQATLKISCSIPNSSPLNKDTRQWVSFTDISWEDIE